MDLQTPAGLSLLLSVSGIGSKTALAIARAVPTWDALVAASDEQLQAVAGTRAAKADWSAAVAMEPRQLEHAVSFFDDAFPNAFRTLDDPPALLWIRGNLSPGLTRAGAVVGTRHPSRWGERVAEAAAEALVTAGATVVSGLALGIDGVAHRAALAANGHTVAVLGSGVDAPTPSEHASLADEILSAGGAVLAEVPPGTTPSPRTLVARNRLQSGLSRLTVVAQCGVQSGTLHTARFTLLQGRRLIVPQPVGPYRETKDVAGNLALAMSPPDPDLVKASSAVARTLACRERLADDVPDDGTSLASAIAAALDSETPHVEQGKLL